MILRYYTLIFTISLFSSLVAQTLRITSPKDGDHWTVPGRQKISWEARSLSGTLEIQYSETGGWRSWETAFPEVTVVEGEVSWYVKEDIVSGETLYIRIKSLEKTSVKDEVTINISNRKTQPPIDPPSPDYLLITKDDNIRKGALQSYDRIKYCYYNERYEILGKEGSWYKIKLDRYPNYGYTHYTNGVVVTQKQLDRGVSADDYVKRSPPTPPVQPKLLSNHLSLISGNGYIGYSSKFTYGYILSGPLLKLGPLLIGSGSISADYRSTYRVGLGFNSGWAFANEIDILFIIYENFMDKNDNQYHIIDLGLNTIINGPDMYVKLGYRHQFENGRVFDDSIQSSLSGFHFEIGLYGGWVW